VSDRPSYNANNRPHFALRLATWHIVITKQLTHGMGLHNKILTNVYFTKSFKTDKTPECLLLASRMFRGPLAPEFGANFQEGITLIFEYIPEFFYNTVSDRSKGAPMPKQAPFFASFRQNSDL